MGVYYAWLAHDSLLRVKGYFGRASPILIGVYQIRGKNQQKMRETSKAIGLIALEDHFICTVITNGWEFL